MSGLNQQYNENRYILLNISVFLYMFSYLGFSYTPYLDDYVQYILYPSIAEPWKNVLFGGVGTAFTRPLAAVFDIFVWSRFRSCFGVAVFILITFYALSGTLFYKAFRRSALDVSPIFLTIYLFSPLYTEGIYWISASSRICTSLLAGSVSAYIITSQKNNFLLNVLFTILTFASFCFYEQTAALCFTVCLYLAHRRKKRFYQVVLWLCFAIIVIYYFSFKGMGNNSHRILGTGISAVLSNAKKVSKSFMVILTSVLPKIVISGTKRGLINIIADRSFLWLIGALSAFILTFFVSLKVDCCISVKPPSVIFIFAAILMPILIFLILPDPMINLRNTVTLNIGTTLALDRLFSVFLKKHRSLIAAIFVLICTLSVQSEVCDYNKTAQSDEQLIKSVSDYFIAHPEKTDLIISVSDDFYMQQNAPFCDHIMSIRGSYWGISGPVRALSGRHDVTVNLNVR